MTTRARTRPRVPAAALAELALPALTVAFGLQLLRLMIPTVVSVHRDRLGASLVSLALFAFGVFLLGFLAAPVARLLGPGRALTLAAGGVALVRLVLQLVPDALARWLLAPVGVVLFLWFVPLWIGSPSGRTSPVRPGRRGWGGGFGVALLAGLALDTALHGLFGTWDYAWSLRPVPLAFAVLLAAAALWALARLPAPASPVHTTVPVALAVAAGGGRDGRTPAARGSDGAVTVAAATGPARWGLGDVLPLAGIGPALFLHALVWQNLGWQAVLGGQPPARAFLLVMLANLAALLAVAGIAAGLAGPAAEAPRLVEREAPPADLARSDGAGAGGPRWLPVWVGVALLLAPAAFWASAPAAAPAGRPGPPLRLMSYNLHFGYDVEGWSDLEAAARAIEAGGADVVGLQEVSHGWYLNGSTDMLAWLQRRLRMPYARFAGAADAIWGNAILSRYPIADSGVVPLPREGVPLARNYLWADLDLGGGRLRLVVTHLHHVEGPEGTRVRLAQIPRLLEGVAGRRATVLLGDLNAEPGSPEIALLRGAGLADAFQVAGGAADDELTYPSDRPERRIDHLWLSPDLRAGGFGATTVTASDHRGVVATVAPAA